MARFGVQVFDHTPDEDTVAMLAEQQATVDDDIDEEDAATILTPEESAGLSKDPLRAYLRGVGSHKLLTREGEIEVAKSIEQHRARLVSRPFGSSGADVAAFHSRAFDFGSEGSRRYGND